MLSDQGTLPQFQCANDYLFWQRPSSANSSSFLFILELWTIVSCWKTTPPRCHCGKSTTERRNYRREIIIGEVVIYGPIKVAFFLGYPLICLHELGRFIILFSYSMRCSLIPPLIAWDLWLIPPRGWDCIPLAMCPPINTALPRQTCLSLPFRLL